MECPSCSSEDVEYESTYTTIHNMARVVATIPSALYQCNNCGCDFEWVKGDGLRIISDGVDQMPVDFVLTNNP